MRFSLKYFILFVLLFGVLVLIAKYLHDDFIRPFAGDYLVVIMLYTFIRCLTKMSIAWTALYVLLIAFTIEGLQALNLIENLSLEENRLAQAILGSTFDPLDLLIYFLAFCSILWIEFRILVKREDKTSVEKVSI